MTFSAKALQTQWKLSGTLPGPGTLFLEDGVNGRAVSKRVKGRVGKEGDCVCASFRCLGCASISEVARVRLVEQFKDQAAWQADAMECYFFRVGKKKGAVYSEPPLDCIVPGKEAELRGVMDKWGMEFPRAWSFGNRGVSATVEFQVDS